MPTDLPEILRDLEIKRLLTENVYPTLTETEAAAEKPLPAFTVQVVTDDQVITLSANDLTQRIAHLLHIARTVAAVTGPERSVADELLAQVVQGLRSKLSALPERDGRLELQETELSVLLEATLIEEGAFDAARVLVMQRALRQQPLSVGVLAPSLLRLIRRSGQVVPWQEHKIEIAVRKAFLSLHQDSEPAVGITQRVAERVRALGSAYVTIETVQDLVQEEMIRSGYAAVAEAYILYRANRTLLRLQEQEQRAVSDAETLQSALLPVLEEDGTNQLWDGQDLRERIRFAGIGLDLCLSPEEIERELRRSLQPEMRRADVNKTILLNAKTLMERDADFAFFAGRILLTFVYEETLDWDVVRDGLAGLTEAHRVAFRRYLEHGIQIGRLSDRLQSYDIDALAAALDPTADLDFDYLGLQTLYDRYLITDKTGKKPRRIEAPQFFWMRVAMGLFLNEKTEKEAYALGLYRLYKERRFCSSTPTLFNSGTPHSQLSSCYLYKVDDSIESIMYRGIAENAFLSKWAGGLGGSWTSVRGTGSYINGTNGESQGVIPFLKMHNDQLVAVNQGGKRAGSGCAYLEIWHNDIFDFLELRRNTGDERRRTHDMNTANWIPDLFMKRMEARQHWTLFRASDTPDLHDLYGRAFEQRYEEYERQVEAGQLYGKRIEALELWKQMLKMLFETGHPWMTFKDPCNVRSPQDHAGVVHSSNLCTEITLNTSEDETAVCNLGSVVLDMHLTPDGAIDLVKLRETVRIAVRALDNVIDLNYYPTEAARRSNLRHRPIGLGVMGLQYALYKKGIAFASEEAVAFNDELMEAVAYYAYEASSDLAAAQGTYSSYAGSKWERGLLPQDTLNLLEAERGQPIDVPRGGKLDWEPLRSKIRAQGMRNSNVLAIAPTATIANIMGTSPCIEPLYKNLYAKSNLSGDFVVLNPFLVRDLKAAGVWTPEVVSQIKYFDGDLQEIPVIPAAIQEKYRTAFHIPYTYLLDAAARRQKWIDQSQSLNLFLASPDMKALSHMYRHAWRIGLKTTYYLRTLGASNIEKATVQLKEVAPAQAAETVKQAAVMGESAPTTTEPSLRLFTEEERLACSIEAMRNGEICASCQ
jgi:ribonucleoside-diphosphate reductase alpha chain